MSERRISVVVPTLNSAATLEWTLLSLREQRGCAVDVLVVDSGSTDGTLEICTRWGVPTIYVAPGNIYRAINAGLSQRQGEWLAYLNSDDWVYPDTYLRLISHGEAAGGDIVYGNCDYADGAGRFLYSFSSAAPHVLPSLFRVGVFGFAQQAAIFRQHAYRQLEGFDETYSLSADCDFYARAALAPLRLVRLAGPSVASFRLHGRQLSVTKAAAMRSEIRAIRHRLGQRVLLRDRARFVLWRMANWHHYVIRFLRVSSFSRGPRFTRSIDTYFDLPESAEKAQGKRH